MMIVQPIPIEAFSVSRAQTIPVPFSQIHGAELSIMNWKQTRPRRPYAGMELILLGFPLTLITIFLCASNASQQGDDLPVCGTQPLISICNDLVFVLVIHRLTRTVTLFENMSPNSKGQKLIWSTLFFFIFWRWFDKLQVYLESTGWLLMEWNRDSIKYGFGHCYSVLRELISV